MTRAVLGGRAEKIMLSRSSARIVMGNHALTAPQDARRMSGTYPVHHFKWDASVVPRLERRLAEDWKRRCHWWPESERALEWINTGRWQRFEGLSVYDFEDDRRSDEGGPRGGSSMRYLKNQARAALGARVPLE